MKRSKLLNIVCSMTISVLFIILLLLGLILSGVISVNTNKLVIRSDSAQSVYNGVPLTCEEWQIVSGELKEGHTLQASFSGVQTYAGQSQNVFHVVIRDSGGTDVTSTYDLILEYGTLEVMPKPIKIVSGNAQKAYDGQPLTCPDWSYYPQNALLSGCTIEVEVVGSITDPGFAPNTIGSVTIYNETGKDITANYEITLEYGFLTVLGFDGLGGLGGMINGGGMLDLSGNICGNELDGSGEDVVCYQVLNQVDDKVYLKLKSFGDFGGNSWYDAEEYDQLINYEFSADYLTGSAINETHAMITINSLNGQYALPYYMTRTSSGYQPQHSDVIYTGDTDSEYLVYYAKFDPDAQYKTGNSLRSYERDYRDFVYSQYLYIDDESAEYMKRIIKEQGFDAKNPDTVFKIAEYIQNSATYNLEYDRELDNADNVAIAFLNDYKEGICQHYATAATLLYRAMGIPARYTVGFTGDTIADEWVDITAKSAHAWVEVYLDGIGWMMVEVTGGMSEDIVEPEFEITLKPVNVEKLYDGYELTASDKISGFDEFYAQGYTIDVKVEGSRTTYGKSKSRITDYTIYDPDGNEATDRFDVTLREGTVHVYIGELVFTSSSISKVYDGQELQTDIKTCYRSSGMLRFDGEIIMITPNASITDVGVKRADFKVTIMLDKQDITDYYKIIKDCGVLTVTHRSITVKADDAQKIYDGTPLVSESYSITEGELVDGQYISNCIIKIEQERIGVGRSQCIPSDVVISDADGNDVTKNYTVKYEEGTLRVLPE